MWIAFVLFNALKRYVTFPYFPLSGFPSKTKEFRNVIFSVHNVENGEYARAKC